MLSLNLSKVLNSQIFRVCVSEAAAASRLSCAEAQRKFCSGNAVTQFFGKQGKERLQNNFKASGIEGL